MSHGQLPAISLSGWRGRQRAAGSACAAAAATAPTRLRLLSIVGTAGLVSGMLGTGGASLLVPALTEIAGISQHRAHAMALAAMAVTTTVAALVYGSRGQIDLPLALGLAATSAGGAVVGARLMCRLPASTLCRLFAGCLVLIALRLLVTSNPARVAGLGSDGQLALLAAGVGTLAGFLSGLLGIGGGAVLVPGLVCLLGMDQVAAQGVSLAVIVPTAIAGAVTHHRLGHLDLSMVGWLAPAGIAGGLAGALAVGRLDPHLLRVAFALFLLVAGARMARRR